ncbi:MAG: DUF1800 domain-containing protein, partial [Wenzhouxiangellaceae bacterium]
ALTIAALIRRAYGPRQLFERMAEFWSDHFSVSIGEAVLATFKLTEERDLIRPNALGSFETLLQGNARSPAMLFYLDNFNNTAEGPNENYARELLELHTLGVDGGYTENDIKEVARVFTGWTIRLPGVFVFNLATHDWSEKQVFDRTIEASGEAEGDQLLTDLATHPATARHLATKLARRFYADLPDPEVIDDVATTFQSSGGDTREVLRTLLLHPLVMNTPAIKFTRPNEFAAGLARALGAELTGESLNAMFELLDGAGHLPYLWPAPDGYPDQRAYWQSANGLLARFNTASAWTRDLAGQSAVLRDAAAIEDLRSQLDFLVDQLRMRPLDAVGRRQMLRYANQLTPEERPGAIAAWLLAGPDAQWR